MKPRLVYVTTAGCSVNSFFKGRLKWLQSRGFDITAVASPGRDLEEVRQREGVKIEPVAMEREMSPIRDLASLVRLVVLFRKLRPDIVNAGTPKAGLLATIAGWIARVPVRIYSVHGLRLETTRGLKRRILEISERIASALAHRVICVSESLRGRYLELGLARAGKLTVLGPGSVNGVDVRHFPENAAGSEAARLLRAHLGIPPEIPVIGFVGRLTRDKGVSELLDAFEQLQACGVDTRLLMLGGFEDGDPIPAGDAARLKSHPKVILTGHVANPRDYYPLMDVLAFPSYREGFPTVIMEAAAARVPTVAFFATGSVDAVQDGVTGVIVPTGNATALSGALLRYLKEPALCRAHGDAARERVERLFRPEFIWECAEREYRSRLKEGVHAERARDTIER